jgi:hypothetical protein
MKTILNYKKTEVRKNALKKVFGKSGIDAALLNLGIKLPITNKKKAYITTKT